MNIINKKEYPYSFDPAVCDICSGLCCCGETGYIWVNQTEIIKISKFLKINPVDFRQDYIEKIDNRLSIKEHKTERGFECVFFGGKTGKCKIYEVRPRQCAEFPFWERYLEYEDQAIKDCPGIKF